LEINETIDGAYCKRSVVAASYTAMRRYVNLFFDSKKLGTPAYYIVDKMFYMKWIFFIIVD